MKDKVYYREIYNQKWQDCLKEAEKDIQENGDKVDIIDIATQIFEETANKEEIVGYYLTFHKDFALKVWLNNTKGFSFSRQDEGVDKILRELYM